MQKGEDKGSRAFRLVFAASFGVGFATMGEVTLELEGHTMPSTDAMISYAQNAEDVVLARALAEVKEGFYVDVGACDPVEHSITYHFYNQGWRGINFEPGRIFEKLAAARPRDVNLPVAVSDRPGEMTFYEYPNAIGLSSLHDRVPDATAEALANRIQRTVQVRPLREVFEQYAPPTIDFMKVDVESHERAVLQSNDWTRWRPRIVLVEATLDGRFEPGQHLWEDILLEADYEFVLWDGLNRFYVRKEEVEYLQPRLAPVNWADYYLTPHQQHLLQVNQELETRLNEMTRGVGGRTLQFGLMVARVLHGLAQVPQTLLGRKAA
jgi:FkbM family methyltransferase